MNADRPTAVPDPGWLQEAVEWGEEHLRSIPYELLGPAGRILVDGIRVRDAERTAESDEPLPDNVVRFPVERRS